MEQAIHTFDIARYLMGEVRSVFSQMDNLFHGDVEGYTVEDVSATVLRFKNGAVGTICTTNGAIPNLWISDYKLVAAKRTVYFNDPNNAIIYHTDSFPVRTTTIASKKDLKLAETLDLLDAIENNRDPKVPMVEGAKTLRLVLAVNRSAQTGEVVSL